jgi:hypothetical protein
MKAWEVAIIYLGSFLTIGLAVKLAARRWMGRGDLDIHDVQAQLDPRRGRRRLFLLGAWRDEGPDR